MSVAIANAPPDDTIDTVGDGEQYCSSQKQRMHPMNVHW